MCQFPNSVSFLSPTQKAWLLSVSLGNNDLEPCWAIPLVFFNSNLWVSALVWLYLSFPPPLRLHVPVLPRPAERHKAARFKKQLPLLPFQTQGSICPLKSRAASTYDLGMTTWTLATMKAPACRATLATSEKLSHLWVIYPRILFLWYTSPRRKQHAGFYFKYSF
jgi:hypothetical protein